MPTDDLNSNPQQERRTLIAVVLCLVVFYVWSYFYGPKPVPVDPTAQVATETTPAPSPAPTAEPATPTPAPATPPITAEGPCTSEPQALNTEVMSLDLENCGGGVSAIRIPGVPSQFTVTPWWSWIFGRVTGGLDGQWTPYTAPAGVETLMSKGAFAVAGRGDFAAEGRFQRSGEGPIELRRTTQDGLSIVQTFSATDEPDVLDLVVRFEATQPIAGPFWVGIADTFEAIANQTDSKPGLEAGVDGRLWLLSQDGKRSGCQGMWSSLSAGEAHGEVSWLGISDRYFMAALLPQDAEKYTLRFEPLADGRVAGLIVAPDASLSPGAPLSMHFKVYAGKKDVSRLVEVGNDLHTAVALGIFGFFSRILLFFLHVFQSFIGNWGLSIIVLTFFVRLIFYPLSASAFKNGKKMQLVQPKLKALQALHKDDSAALNQATMKLFAEEKVNPFGGCLPIFFQIPVFFALYSGLQLTPDLLHAPFLYIQDLSAPDPLGIFPFLIFVGMVLQQRLTPMQGMDPQQQTMMKMMPFIFSFMMFGLPAGLSVYYAVNSGLAILQQWYNTRSHAPPELRTNESATP